MKKRENSNIKNNVHLNKKAQITIFIIISLIIIAITILIIYLGKFKIDSENSKQYFSQSDIKPELNNIQDSIINCLDETSKQSLTLIGIQGGYYNQPEKSFNLGWTFIPYYYDKGEFLIPSKTTITNQLQLYTNEKINNCLNRINKGDFSLEYKNPKTTASIQEQSVKFTIDLSITIERENNKIKFQTKEHPVTIDSKLNDILEIADYITESHRENYDLICVNCLTQIAEEKEVYIDMLEFQESDILIQILENKTQEEPYIFEFLNRYE